MPVSRRGRNASALETQGLLKFSTAALLKLFPEDFASRLEAKLSFAKVF